MVPLQLELEGFLCYKDRQKFDFSGASLWMLCGANGAGKSAVFDAIRFALFGQTRTGVQGTDALIHRQKKSARVVLTCEIGGETVRLTRTVSLKRSTWQIERLENDIWTPIPQTDGRDGFRDWLENHLGFSDETFRATMYLGQGKADRLLDANTAERTEILAQIVDLKPFQRLHDGASERARLARAGRERTLFAWQNLPVVEPHQLENAGQNWGESRAQLEKTRAEIGDLERHLPLAAQWEILSGELHQAQSKREILQHILAGRAQIEHDFARLVWLESALPILENGGQLRAEIAQLESQTAQIAARLETAQGELEAAKLREIEAENARKTARDELEKRRDWQTQSLLRASEIAPLLALSNRQQELETQARKIAEKAAELPDNLEEKWEIARQNREAARQTREKLPHARALREAVEQERAAQEKLAELRQKISALEAAQRENETLLKQEEEAAKNAENQWQTARENEAKRRAQWEEIGAAIARYQSLEDAARCAFCGQELSPEHRQNEGARLERERGEARSLLEQASENLGCARQNFERLQQSAARLQESARANLHALLRAQNEAELSGQELKNAREKRDLAARNLGWDGDENRGESEFSPAILGDWEARAELLPALEKQLAELESARQNARDLEREKSRLEREIVEISAKMGDEGSRIREENAVLEARLKSLSQEIETWQTETVSSERVVQKVAARRQQFEENCGVLRRELEQIAAPLEARRGAWGQLIGGLNGELRALLESEKLEWQSCQLELKRLETAGVRDQNARLQAASRDAEELENQLALIARQIEAIPVGARFSSRELEEKLALLREQQAQKEREERELAREFRELERIAQEKEDAGLALARAENEERQWGALRDLLGREGLQKFLLVEAENGIIEAANEVLERLSSGSLFLHLADAQAQFGGINRQSGALNFVVSQEDENGQRQTILAPYLSGSQRFRVAVALAVGMGRFAAQHTRGARMESVIIDEGFGSLDKLGREEMRDELQNLGRELRRVMVVSHQDDFAENFPNRYLIVREGLASHAVLQSA